MPQREGWTLFHHVFRYYAGAKRVWKWEVGWYSNLDREAIVASGVADHYRDAKAAMMKAKEYVAASDEFVVSTRRRERIKV